MSKSLGNSIEPQDIIKQSGADMLRLWVAMADYTRGDAAQPGDPRAGSRGLSQDPNTFRYLIAEPVRLRSGAATRCRTWPLTRSIDTRSPIRRSWPATVLRAYDAYDYPTIFHTLNTFLTVDLSAFYLDVSKDRLYTLGAVAARGARQTAIYEIADGLTRLVAPILSMTADEVWRHLPGRGRIGPSRAVSGRGRLDGCDER